MSGKQKALVMIAEAMSLLAQANMLLNQQDEDDDLVPVMVQRRYAPPPKASNRLKSAEWMGDAEPVVTVEERLAKIRENARRPKQVSKAAKPFVPSPSTKPSFYTQPAKNQGAARTRKARLQEEADRLKAQSAVMGKGALLSGGIPVDPVE